MSVKERIERRIAVARALQLILMAIPLGLGLYANFDWTVIVMALIAGCFTLIMIEGRGEA